MICCDNDNWLQSDSFKPKQYQWTYPGKVITFPRYRKTTINDKIAPIQMATLKSMIESLLGKIGVKSLNTTSSLVLTVWWRIKIESTYLRRLYEETPKI